MAIVEKHGLPISVHVHSASPHEVTLVEATLAERFTKELPQHLIGDKAYDSDALDSALARLGVEMISPHRAERRYPTQDGRPLRRYKKRWRVERFNAWLLNFRRVLVRWENKLINYRGFVLLACAVILAKWL